MEKFEASIQFLEKRGLSQCLLYIFEHPEGVQKVNLRNLKGLAPSTAVSCHKILYEFKMIQNIPSDSKLLFNLTKKGVLMAKLIRTLNALLNESPNFKESPSIDRITQYTDLKDELHRLIFSLSSIIT